MRKFLSVLLAVTVMLSLSLPVFADSGLNPEVAGTYYDISQEIKTVYGSSYVDCLYFSETSKEVLYYVNEERVKNGLPKLVWQDGLVNAAMMRACEASVKWSHTRPNNSSFATVAYLAEGENLAKGDINADGVVQGWMASTLGHRENILDKDWKSMAVACIQTEESTYWAQLFSTSGASGSTANTTKVTTASASTGAAVSSADVIAALNTVSGTAVTATVRDKSTISPSAVSDIAKWATSKGKTVSLVSNTVAVEGDKTVVQGQLTFNPSKFTAIKADMGIGVYTTSANVSGIADSMAKWYSNNMAVIRFDHKGDFASTVNVAARVDLSKLNTKALQFYTYDTESNSVSKIASPSYSVDGSYVYFNTTSGGYVIITDKALTLR